MADYKAIVTGGARGIGYAITSALLEAGGKVCFLDILATEGVKAQKDFDEKYGSGKAVFLQCDVSNKKELHDVFHEAKSRMGGLNVVCNNAGVEFDEEEIARSDEMISINVGGVINGSMLGLELMDKGSGGDGGVIINTSSIGGVTLLLPFIPVYSATKAAVAHFSRCIALTAPNEHGVRVNCIAPAAVATDMLRSFMNSLWNGKIKAPDHYMQRIPNTDEEARNRAIKPSDISQEIIKLISDESKNGQVLLIQKNPEDPTQLKVEHVDFK